MKKLLTWLFVSISVLVIVLLFYFRGLANKNISGKILPIIYNNSIGVLHVPNFDTSVNEFSESHIYKSLPKSSFVDLIVCCKGLLKSEFSDDNLDFKSPVFISLNFDEIKNCVEYLLFFSRKYDDKILVKSVKDKSNVSDDEMYSVSLKGFGKPIIMHCVNVGDYIIISQSKDLIVKYLKDCKSSRSKFFRDGVEIRNCCFVTNSQNVRKYLEENWRFETLPEDLVLVLDSMKEQICIPIKITNRCLALDLFLDKKNFDSIPNISDCKKSSLQQYYTINTSALKIFSTSDLESIIEDKKKIFYLKSDEDRLFVSTIASLFGDEVACLTLDYSDRKQIKDFSLMDSSSNRECESGSVIIFSLNDAKFFAELLFSRGLISVEKAIKGGCTIYSLADCILNKYIIENLFPNSRCRYIVLLSNCVALSSSVKALTTWYNQYSLQMIWHAPKNSITHVSNISYIWNLENRGALFAKNFKPSCQKTINDIFINVQTVTLQILVQKDGVCNVSSLVVW